MSQRLKDWWTGGGFIQVATILVAAGITWGTTIATIENDKSGTAKSFEAFGRQLEEIKQQISGVRAAQDGVLKLQGEVDALRQRLVSLELDYKTQIQINSVLRADIARLQGDVTYLGRN